MADDNNDDPPPEAFLSRQTVTNSNKIPTTEAAKDPDVIEEALKEASPKVEQMQKRQKEIEEENKKKRKLLLDTITERLLKKTTVQFLKEIIYRIFFVLFYLGRNKPMQKKRN